MYNEEQNFFLETDYLIIGGGLIGIYLAVGLNKMFPDNQVTILERGGKSWRMPGNNGFKFSKEYNRSVVEGRAFGLGGTSNLWGGQIVKFDKVDFEREENEWPLVLSDLEIFYQKAYSNITGFQYCEQNTINKKQSLPEVAIKGLERFHTHWLPNPVISSVFKENLKDKNISIFLEKTVIDTIELDTSKNKTRFIDKSGNQHCIISKKTIIACGYYETVRLCLNNKDPAVSSKFLAGSGIHDHIGAPIAKVKIVDKSKFRKFFETSWVKKNKIQPKLKFTSEKNKSVGLGIAGSFYSDSSLNEAFSNIKNAIRSFTAGVKRSNFSTLFQDFFAVSSALVPIIFKFVIQRRIYLPTSSVRLFAQIEVPSKIKNTISLDNLDNKLNIDWSFDAIQVSALKEFVCSVDQYLKENKLGYLYKINIPSSTNDLKNFKSTNHPGGGLRMSSSKHTGFVDENCRIWNKSNTYIVSSAILPTASHANTSFTLLALAERLIQHFGIDEKEPLE